MDGKRSTIHKRITSYNGDPESSGKRATVLLTDKETDKRASKLVKLGLADDEQAQVEASLLADEVTNVEQLASSTYHVQILGTDLAANKTGKAFTVYKVEITYDVRTWIIYRRYSQFYALLETLKSEFGKRIVKGFPPKKFVNNLSPASIDRRHQQLQDWLQAMLEDKYVVLSTELQLFIKAGKEDADFVPKQHASTIESDIDLATNLYKYSKGKWKSRWFVLRHGRLYKYASTQEKHPYGFYDLRNCHAALLGDALEVKLKNPKPHTFVVECQSSTGNSEKVKRYTFAAATEDELKKWISCINKEETKHGQLKVFGVPIQNVRNRDENGVPLFLSALLNFLEATALEQEDLFMNAPDEDIKRAIDRGKAVDLAKVAENAHAVAGLIIQYLHELPEPIIPEDMGPVFYSIFEIKEVEKRYKMLGHFSEILPIINRNLLIKVFAFLDKASKASVKRERLIKIFGRIIFRFELDPSSIAIITDQMIDHWDSLVVLDEAYAAPEKVLVIKKRKSVKSSKKKGTKEAAIDANTENANSYVSSSPSNAKNNTSSPTKATPALDTKIQDSKQVFNDFYDSNEEIEESSEEEEWTDEEVQVISEFDSAAGYSDEEVAEHYQAVSSDDLDALSKAAASLPNIEVSPLLESSDVPPSPKSAKTSSKANIDDTNSGDEFVPPESPTTTTATTASSIEADPQIISGDKTKSSKKHKRDKTKQDANLASSSSPSLAATEPTSTTEETSNQDPSSITTEAQSESTTKSRKDKKSKKDAGDDSVASVKSVSKESLKPSTSLKDSKESLQKDNSDAANAPATPESAPKSEKKKDKKSKNDLSSKQADIVTSSPKSEKKDKKAKQQQQLQTSDPPNSNTGSGDDNTNVTKSPSVPALTIPTSNPESSQEAGDAASPPLSPHTLLSSPTGSRPKIQRKHAPTSARTSVMPYARPEAPALTPQEQLVADLGRALGRRPPAGGVALFPMGGPPKK